MPQINRPDAIIFIEEIREVYSQLLKTTPTIPQKVIDEFNETFGADGISKPTIAGQINTIQISSSIGSPNIIKENVMKHINKERKKSIFDIRKWSGKQQSNPYDHQSQSNPYDHQSQSNPYDHQSQSNPYDHQSQSNPYDHQDKQKEQLQVDQLHLDLPSEDLFNTNLPKISHRADIKKDIKKVVELASIRCHTVRPRSDVSENESTKSSSIGKSSISQYDSYRSNLGRRIELRQRELISDDKDIKKINARKHQKQTKTDKIIIRITTRRNTITYN